MESRFGYDGEQSGSRLELLLEASGVVGTWEWDHVQHTVTYDHGGATYLTGDSTLAGRPLQGHEAMKTVHRDDYYAMIEQSVQAAQKGGVIIAEYRVDVPDRGLRCLLSRGRTYQDAQGRPVRSHGILIDITDSHDKEKMYVVGAELELDDKLHLAANYLISAREILDLDVRFHMTHILDLVLMETGRLIAQRVQEERDRTH